MEYELEVEQEWLCIRLPKELDHFQAEQIRSEVKEKMQNHYIQNVVFDFQNTTFMDSSGIGLIAGRYREIQIRGGKVYVEHVNDSMNKALTLSGLYRIVIPWKQEETESEN